jgi:peptide/nickel transport system substrate-binding protein
VTFRCRGGRSTRRGPGLVVCAALGLAATGLTGCGGFSSRAAASGSDPRIFNVGTNSRIDSLNPFVLTETEAFDVADLVYPQLVSYGGARGKTIVGDWARTWSSSHHGRVWTFHLRPGRWSDGVRLTASDAVWTITTELHYASGAAALLAGALTGITKVSAPNARTLVVTYGKPVGNVLAQLEQVWILPEHVWRSRLGQKGMGLKTYPVSAHLPLVAGGPFTVTTYSETGTTVLKRNPYFYGPKPSVAAIAISFYTDTDAMLLSFDQGQIDAIDSVPFVGLSAVRSIPGTRSITVPGDTVIPLLFNSSPAKPRNRELLSPKVRQALDMAVNRSALINVAFDGDARPWGNWISEYSGSWADPAIKPPRFDPGRANAILNSLGYKRGPGGVRIVPATHGRYAQAAHPMSYPFAVPGDLPFNGSRLEEVVAQDWAAVGVKIHEVDIGDTDASYAYYQENGRYRNWDIGTWYYAGYVDPNYTLQFPTKAQWDDYNDTGYDNPAYDHLFALQSHTVNQQARRAIVWRMEGVLAHDLPYAPLVNLNYTMALGGQWPHADPNLYGFKSFFERLGVNR